MITFGEGKHNLSYDTMNRWMGVTVSPYLMFAYGLIDKPRKCGGNMFRHQLTTMAILLDYGYADSVLIKASVVHDVIEDIPEFDENEFHKLDEGKAVLDLVKEVSKRKGETKKDFLTRIKKDGSFNAKVLKSADRIDNVISLGIVLDMKFVERYVKETEDYVYPIAEDVNKFMLNELKDLIKSRKILLSRMQGQ